MAKTRTAALALVTTMIAAPAYAAEATCDVYTHATGADRSLLAAMCRP